LPAETAIQLVEAIRGSDVIVESGEPRRRQRGGLKIVLQELEVAAIGLTAMGPLGALMGSLRHRASRRKTGEAKANASPARLTPEESDVVIRTARTLAKAIDIPPAMRPTSLA
jgi:uncharacterized protein (DUF2384 family)